MIERARINSFFFYFYDNWLNQLVYKAENSLILILKITYGRNY